PANGSINTVLKLGTTTVSGTDLDNYTFTWEVLQSGVYVTLAGETGATLSNRDIGDYRVTASNPTLGCTSDPVFVVIGSDKVYPAIKIENNTPNSSCDPDNGNGSITVSVGGTITGYKFEWFEGRITDVPLKPLGTTVGTVDGDAGETANDLSAGIYTVLVTSEATGCGISRRITVGENISHHIVNKTESEYSIC